MSVKRVRMKKARVTIQRVCVKVIPSKISFFMMCVVMCISAGALVTVSSYATLSSGVLDVHELPKGDKVCLALSHVRELREDGEGDASVVPINYAKMRLPSWASLAEEDAWGDTDDDMQTSDSDIALGAAAEEVCSICVPVKASPWPVFVAKSLAYCEERLGRRGKRRVLKRTKRHDNLCALVPDLVE